MLKVSAFYLEKQKSFIPKKKKNLAVVNIKTKKLCLLTQFSGKVLHSICISLHPRHYQGRNNSGDIKVIILV
jgi:hypothetical protein